MSLQSFLSNTSIHSIYKWENARSLFQSDRWPPSPLYHMPFFSWILIQLAVSSKIYLLPLNVILRPRWWLLYPLLSVQCPWLAFLFESDHNFVEYGDWILPHRWTRSSYHNLALESPPILQFFPFATWAHGHYFLRPVISVVFWALTCISEPVSM